METATGRNALTYPAGPKPPEKPWKRVPDKRNGYAYHGLTQETLDAFKATWREYEQAWRTWQADCNDIAAAAAHVLIAEGFPKELRISVRGQWLRLDGTRLAGQAQDEASKELRDRAVMWLLAHGRIYGVDFTADTASEVALKIAAQAVITRQTGCWNNFSGQTCEEPCRGWDGESSRCDCGNRRVSWMIDGTFEEPHVWGEAW